MLRRVALVTLILALAAGTAWTRDDEYRKQNVGLILDTPFLHQDLYPYASEFFGAYGNESVTYEYNGRGLPVFIRYSDAETGIPFVEMEASYRPDGHLEQVVYLSYDEDGETVAFRDEFTFSEYGDTGPRLGYLLTSDGGSAEMRLTYDPEGRLIALEEDDAYGNGLFRSERYVWTNPDRWPALPYALEVYYAFDREVERYFYLYDANDRLIALEGENTPLADPLDSTYVGETYSYRRDMLDDIFRPVAQMDGAGQTALR
jgi:hypothetical protein